VQGTLASRYHAFLKIQSDDIPARMLLRRHRSAIALAADVGVREI
jgi:hypothetical protein